MLSRTIQCDKMNYWYQIVLLFKNLIKNINL